jgi:hypothetical protein
VEREIKMTIAKSKALAASAASRKAANAVRAADAAKKAAEEARAAAALTERARKAAIAAARAALLVARTMAEEADRAWAEARAARDSLA